MTEPYTFDLQRIFFGDAPPVFLLEILLRTSILFVYTLAALRLVGARGVGQLSMGEFAVIIALGSAVGDPLFYPDVPLVHGMVVIGLIVLFQRWVTLGTMRSRRLGWLVEGHAVRVVYDGRLDEAGLKRARLSQAEVMAELRQNGVEDLGTVRRAFMELDGEMSVFLFRAEDAPPPRQPGAAPVSLLALADAEQHSAPPVPPDPSGRPHMTGTGSVRAGHDNAGPRR